MARLVEHVEARVVEAVEKYKLGLGDVDHHAAFGIVPGPGGPIPAWIILVSIKNPLLGQPDIGQVSVLPQAKPSQEDIDAGVLQCLDLLRTQRAQIMNGTDPAVGENR